VATSKVTQVLALTDENGQKTGKVGIEFEVSSSGLWRFLNNSPAIFVDQAGNRGRMTPAEDHPLHLQTPALVATKRSFWYIWDAFKDGINIDQFDVLTWGYQIPMVNVQHGLAVGRSTPTRHPSIAKLDADIGDADLAETPSKPTVAPSFSQDPTWAPEAAQESPKSGTTEDASGHTIVRPGAPGVPRTALPTQSSPGELAQEPNYGFPESPISQPGADTEDSDGVVTESAETPALAEFPVPVGSQEAPDLKKLQQKQGIDGVGNEPDEPVKVAGRKVDIPNLSSSTASLKPVPFLDYQAGTAGDSYHSSAAVAGEADASLTVLMEPRVIPVGEYAAVSVLVKNRHHAGMLTNVGLYLEARTSDGQRIVIANGSKDITLGPGESVSQDFRFEVRDLAIGDAIVTGVLFSAGGAPMAKKTIDFFIGPSDYSARSMGRSAPEQFVRDEKLPSEVVSIINASDAGCNCISAGMYRYGQPWIYQFQATKTNIGFALQLNGMADAANVRMRMRVGRGTNFDDYVEVTQPLQTGSVVIHPGTQAGAIGLTELLGTSIASGDQLWVSVEQTTPLYDPSYVFTLHANGAQLLSQTSLLDVDVDGNLSGTLKIPYLAQDVILENTRTLEVLRLLMPGGPADIQERAWPSGSLLAVVAGDQIAVRPGGVFNRFADVYETLTVPA